MRRLICTSIALLFLGVVSSGATQGSAAASGAFLGTWSGTWEGGGSGGFELTLETGQSDTLTRWNVSRPQGIERRIGDDLAIFSPRWSP